MSTFPGFGCGLVEISIGLESAYSGISLNPATVGKWRLGFIIRKGISASSYAIPRIDLKIKSNIQMELVWHPLPLVKCFVCCDIPAVNIRHRRG